MTTRAPDTTAERVRTHFRIAYGIQSLEEGEITTTRGYWRHKHPCDRRTCHAPLHGTLFNEGPLHHPLYFAVFGRFDASGHFLRPFRTWETLRALHPDKAERRE